MSNCINIQVKKISSSFTLNYNVPDHLNCDMPNRGEIETVNFPQTNDSKLEKCRLRGNGTFFNTGNQKLHPSERSNCSFHNDHYAETRYREDSRRSAFRNSGESSSNNATGRRYAFDQRGTAEEERTHGSDHRSSATRSAYSHNRPTSEEVPDFASRSTAQEAFYSSHLRSDRSSRKYENSTHRKLDYEDGWLPRRVNRLPPDELSRGTSTPNGLSYDKSQRESHDPDEYGHKVLSGKKEYCDEIWARYVRETSPRRGVDNTNSHAWNSNCYRNESIQPDIDVRPSRKKYIISPSGTQIFREKSDKNPKYW